MTQIIRTVGELEALDPDTYLMGSANEGLTRTDWVSYREAFADHIFPLAVIATGEQIRAARKTLEDA